MNKAAGTARLFKNLVDAVAIILKDIFSEGRHADRALEQAFKRNPQWGSRDRRFIAEGVYDTVRNFRLFSEVAGNARNYWFITAVWMVKKGFEIPDWPEFRHVEPHQILSVLETLEKNERYKYSYPDWLWDRLQQEVGDRWISEAEAMHGIADVFLRVNTIRSNTASVLKALNAEREIAVPVEGIRDALKLLKRENIFRNNLFKEGLFEVQDAGSQLIAPFSGVQPGQVVIDACAGAGGKSLHLAALMKNKGRLISMDVEQWKLDELKKRARRAGVHMIETRLIEGEENIRALSGKADCVLLDVPCSGTGVLKRNPDTKWKLTEEDLLRTMGLQAKILRNYSIMVIPGGTLVYSTCSVMRSENSDQVEAFLKDNSMFVQEDEQMLWPSSGFDGFYMAKLRRRA